MNTKILLDLSFIFISAGTLILVGLFWLDSVRTMRQSGFSRYKPKDDDDYVSGKKYNEHVGSLSVDLEDSRNRMASFIERWKWIWVIYVIVLTIATFNMLLSDKQINGRLEQVEKEIQVIKYKLQIPD